MVRWPTHESVVCGQEEPVGKQQAGPSRGTHDQAQQQETHLHMEPARGMRYIMWVEPNTKH